MSETNTVTCSTTPHMIQEPPLHQGNPQHQKNKKNLHTKAPNKLQCQPNLMGRRNSKQQVRC